MNQRQRQRQRSRRMAALRKPEGRERTGEQIERETLGRKDEDTRANGIMATDGVDFRSMTVIWMVSMRI
jgi:hypothetical protein